MTPLEVATGLKEHFDREILEISEFMGQVSVTITRQTAWKTLLWLRDHNEFAFCHLADLCGVDFLGRKEPRFEVAYNLVSFRHANRLRIKVPVPDEDCWVDSVVGLWPGANWHERECFDLFGIMFRNHPDLRRVLMPEDWEGHPLRKDYPLKSDLGPQEWKAYLQVVEAAERNKRHEVR